MPLGVERAKTRTAHRTAGSVLGFDTFLLFLKRMNGPLLGSVVIALRVNATRYAKLIFQNLFLVTQC